MLLDLNLPGMGGLELLRRMLVEDQSTRILVLSMHAEPLYAARAMELGARGYLSKNASADELLTAVRRIAEGGRYIENEIAQELALQKVSPGGGVQDLTERDIEIMRLLAEGLSLAKSPTRWASATRRSPTRAARSRPSSVWHARTIWCGWR